MDRYGVTRGRLAATSAARDASNGAGVPGCGRTGGSGTASPSSSPGSTRGGSRWPAPWPTWTRAEGPFLILDIGGGSTELVAGDGPDDPDLAAVSLQIGCVRMSRALPRASDPPTSDELGPRPGPRWRPNWTGPSPTTPDSPPRTGWWAWPGRWSTLASLHHGMAEYDRDVIHHTVLTAHDGWHRWGRRTWPPSRAGRPPGPARHGGRPRKT